MALTKRHFEAIAKLILKQIESTNKGTAERQHLINLTMALCLYFNDENPLFNEDRFLKACGVLK